jgi:alanyl-tRNA synthetase
MPSVNDIRTQFLDYFARHGHEIVGSGPLVPHNDPTLMFTNAGMVQFKNVFTGAESLPYMRATTSQKCVRAGGKHNDLDNVGYTARHHTFFEMLGNFSFADYFKERAIELAWELLTVEMGVPGERLMVTVYAEDDDAFDLWGKIAGLPEWKIVRIFTSDNFWAMGDTGPCGPCSEIFYDHGEGVAGGPPGSADEGGDRFVEIWNLVFMQFEQVTPEQRIDLPKPSIDTGMGLERIAAVLQGVSDNYDTDLFRRLIEASAECSSADVDGPHRISHRVVADHLRASCFLIADGVMPSNEGRGYVLRRIMRRAMRHAHLMGCADPLMWRLVPALVGEMGQAFPELGRAQALITETLKLEETRFRQTLARGLGLLEEETARLGEGEALSGEVAFKLYDTFGFPYDLTEDALRAQGRTVDKPGFDAAMEVQREQARAAWAGSGEKATEQVWFEIRETAGASEFLGYELENVEGRVVALVEDGASVEAVEAPGEIAVLFNQTPFYGESGGQTGDAGTIVTAGGVELEVRDTQKKLGDLHVHLACLVKGRVQVGDGASLMVDRARRGHLRANHSATHLLHAALRDRLGEHVTQKGSLVAPERLRFDVAHPKLIEPAELVGVEAAVNAQIRANHEVVTHLMSPEEATAHGALALFGEKYGDEVRVVEMGRADEHAYSTELCGGTHVRRTGDIGLFTVIGESALAAGVRRIEALTGQAALDYLREQDARLRAAAAVLKTAPGELVARVESLVAERKRLERELGESRKQLAAGGGVGGGAETREVAGIRFSAQRIEGVGARDLKGLVDEMKKQGSGVYAAASEADGKVSLVVGVSDDLTGRLDAVTLVRAGVGELGGKGGGGRPDMAQGGGSDGAKLDAAFAAIEEAIADALGSP